MRCVFCAQDVQTGFLPAACPEGAAPGAASAAASAPCVTPSLPAFAPLPHGDQPPQALSHETLPHETLPHETLPPETMPLVALLHETRCNLERRHALGLPPAELAFYGGTFTAMPEADQAACLDLAGLALERGWIRSFRCSTRPDCVTAPVLERLRAAGCGCVELGVQSFSDAALSASLRGYDGGTALRACGLVKAAGLALGVQLLPGMPGHAPADFLNDVPLALRAGADMLRFYPCLVIEGTALARMWRQGVYSPWSLDVTLDMLAEGWLLAQAARVPVIRMGLAPEAALDGAVLAGPVDRSLGSRVMGRSLLHAVRRAVAACAPCGEPSAPVLSAMRLPKACQGYIWGTRGELRPDWAALGLEPKNVLFDAACGQDIALTLAVS